MASNEWAFDGPYPRLAFILGKTFDFHEHEGGYRHTNQPRSGRFLVTTTSSNEPTDLVPEP